MVDVVTVTLAAYRRSCRSSRLACFKDPGFCPEINMCMWDVSHREGDEASAQRAESRGPKVRELGVGFLWRGSDPLPTRRSAGAL